MYTDIMMYIICIVLYFVLYLPMVKCIRNYFNEKISVNRYNYMFVTVTYNSTMEKKIDYNLYIFVLQLVNFIKQI